MYCRIKYHRQIIYDICEPDANGSNAVEEVLDGPHEVLDIILSPMMAAKWYEDSLRGVVREAETHEEPAEEAPKPQAAPEAKPAAAAAPKEKPKLTPRYPAPEGVTPRRPSTDPMVKEKNDGDIGNVEIKCRFSKVKKPAQLQPPFSTERAVCAVKFSFERNDIFG